MRPLPEWSEHLRQVMASFTKEGMVIFHYSNGSDCKSMQACIGALSTEEVEDILDSLFVGNGMTDMITMYIGVGWKIWVSFPGFSDASNRWVRVTFKDML